MGYDSTKNPFSDDYNPGGDGRGTGVGIADDALALGAGAASVGTDLSSGARALAEKSNSPNAARIADFFRTLMGDAETTSIENMSQDARDRLNSAITGPEFWEHPISAGTLKALNMTPGVAAAVAPIFFSGGVGGVVAAGAALGGGASARDTYDQTDAMSDEEFRQAMPYYDGLRDMGMSERQARRDANQKLMGLKPLINAAGTGLAMALGPAGRLAGMIPEEAGASFLKRMLVGGAEGGVGGAVMGGTAEATHEDTEVDLGKRTGLSPDLILAATAESAAIQAAMGAGGGLLTSGHSTAGSDLRRGSERVEAKGPDAAQELALTGDQTPNVQDVAAEAAKPPTTESVVAKPPTEVTTPEKPVSPVPAEENRPLGSPETPVSAPADISATPEKAPVPEERTFRTTPGAIATEHAAEEFSINADAVRGADAYVMPGRGSALPKIGNTSEIPEMPVHELPTELPPEVTAGIEKRLKSIEEATKRLAAAGQGPKEGVEAFVAAKRKTLEEAAWHEVAKISIADANAKIAAKKTGPKSREGKGVETRQGKHLPKAELEKRAKDELESANIANEHPPTDIEEGDLRRDPEVRAAIMKRAESMVALAGERKVRIFQRLRDSKNKKAEVKSWATLLTMARELKRSDGKSFKAFDDFVAAERLLRTGTDEDKALMLSLRRGEGDAASRAAPTAGKGVEDIADSAASPEDLVDVKRELAVEPIDRPRIADTADRFVEGKDAGEKIKNGLVRVEAKKKLKMRAMEAPQKDARHQAVSDLQKTFQEARSKLQKEIEGKSIHQVAEHIEQNAPRPSDRLIAGRIKRTLGKLTAAGMKFDFHVANAGDLAPANLSGSNALTILKNDGKATTEVWIAGADTRNPGMQYETLLHELIHGATQAALHLGRVIGPLKSDVGKLRQELLQVGNAVVKHLNAKFEDYRNGNVDALTPFEKDIYHNRNNALQTEHEILAWGLSNPEMQDLLESVPYKSGAGKKGVASIFDKFTNAVRNFLGLSANSETALSEVLRVADRLFEQDTNLVVDNVPAIFSRTPRELVERQKGARQPGDFENSANTYNDEIDSLFRPKLGEALKRSAENSKAAAKEFVETAINPPKAIAAILESAHGGGRTLSSVRDYLTTNDQYANRPEVKRLLPNVRDITDIVQKTGIYATKLKEEGLDLSAALLRAQQVNPKLFDMFSKLIHEQTMYGADASAPIGEGRNEHLRLSQELQAKVDANPTGDHSHEAAMSTWEGRRQHAQLKTMYDAIVRESPEYKTLQERIFKFYDDAQKEMSTGQIDHILRTYDFEGTDAERATAVNRIYNDRFTPEFKKELGEKIGESAVDLLQETKALKVVKGPYAPLMRRGEHVIVGEYKLKEPGFGKKIEDGLYEFDTRKEAHKYAVSTGLHAEPKIVYYDPETGKPTTKSEGLSTAGSATEKYQVRVNRRHVEFHEREADARARLKELEESKLFDKLGLEEKRNIVGEQNQFSDRGVERLLSSLEKSKRYQDSSPAQQQQLRASIREAGISSMAGNRVQSRRLPRRFVQGASDDLARNLYDYNSSQANYRAQLKYRPELDDQMKEMWDQVKAHTYDPSNTERSRFANEIEKRVRAQDPNEYSGGYTEAARRLATWSYINVMGRASHLILHQTHLPMITAPYLAGRHGFLRTYGTVAKTWKEMAGAYKNGYNDTISAIADHMAKGTDYSESIKGMLKGAEDQKRVSQMIDHLTELGVIHPQSNIEVGRFMPSKQLKGMAGAFDHGLQRVDTIFRQMTNATEAINRFVGATAAYRMEFAKLTRAGNSADVAHAKAIDYARQAVTDTQGLYSATNAAPLFKNKWLRPFLQFKQFPQMMYHLLGKLAVQSLKGESREVKVQAMASLAGILGMHVMMAGVLQGLPLEGFKLLGLISKSIGLTDSDWTDVEQAVAKEMQDKLGKETASVFLHGLGAEMGVDVHHRLGLNSFVTYGMPDEPNATNMKEFAFNAVVGAPGSMIENSFKGVNQMLNGKLEDGALNAFPMQMFRDIHNAAVAKPYASGEAPTAAERGLMAIGFTPARKAQAREAQEATYNAVHEYNTRRADFIKEWVTADPASRDAVWDKIAKWNEGMPRTAKINKADLFKSLSLGRRSAKNKLDNITLNRHSRDIGRAVADLYQ